jgi:hypothetical protein
MRVNRTARTGVLIQEAIEMKILLFLGAIAAAIFGARKIMKKNEVDEFAPAADEFAPARDDSYATPA